MKIYYVGNQIAGLIGKLTILSIGHEITGDINNCDILLCVHGRKIIPKEIFEKPIIASINVHPYLYAYKGANPISRAIKDSNWHASVGCHKMTEQIDYGEVIKEIFIDVEPSNNQCEIYNQIYHIYVQVIRESLDLLEKQYLDNLDEPFPLVGGIE